MKLFYTLFISIITASLSVAQSVEEVAQERLKGQLVTVNGDTTQVYADLRTKHTNSKHFGYNYKDFAGKSTHLPADEFVSFSSDTKYFVGLDYQTESGIKRIVAEVFIIGEYILYVTVDRSGDEILLYKQRDDEGLAKLIHRESFNQFIKENFKFCDSNSRIKPSSYTSSYMKTVMSADNACRFPDQYEFEKYKFKPKFSIGYAFGFQVNQDKVDQNDVDPAFGLGVQGGIRLKLKFTPHLAIRYDVNLVRKSANYDSWKSNLNYLQYPFFIYASIEDLGRNSNYHISFGATRGRVISYSATGKDMSSFANGSPESLTKGWFVALHRNFNLNNKFFGQLELRYDVNMFQFDADGKVSIMEAKVTQSAIQFMVTMPF